ncbi:hypothetical protein TWF696_002872 [Orbilia brochopaga]|uniref:Uncharacterized protein n=1 Tax=Orbilia brochopaga TaxID=3140254 RepID=A0AAV9U118_9PEZI
MNNQKPSSSKATGGPAKPADPTSNPAPSNVSVGEYNAGFESVKVLLQRRDQDMAEKDVEVTGLEKEIEKLKF